MPLHGKFDEYYSVSVNLGLFIYVSSVITMIEYIFKYIYDIYCFMI